MSARIRIAFCGPIARPGEAVAGGYETGNRSIISGLAKQGVAVCELPYPRVDRYSSTLNKSAVYGGGFISIFREILVTRGKWDVLHFNGHYRQFISFEIMFPVLTRVLGKKLVTHLRAGFTRAEYERRSRLYRWAFDRLLRGSDAVAVQGLEDMDFVRERCSDRAFYLPNFVSEPARDNARLQHPGEELELVYLGAVIKEKGVDVALQAKRWLEDQGFKARMTIVGTGNPDYLALLKREYPEQSVRWLGAVGHDKVREAVRGAHFFVFPTLWHGEGHSNALTETMAEGIVPICSDHGFNRRIVADTGEIVPCDASAARYGEEMARIWRDGSWPALSRKSSDRVRELYTADVVIDKLIGLYERLLESRA